MDREIDILIPGEINPDLILSDPALEVRFGQHETLVENFAMTIGSSSAIFACATARLGLRTTLVGVVGDDLFGKFMCDALEKRGVDISYVVVDRRLSTGLSVILNRRSDRAILTYLGAIDRLRAEQVSGDLLARARHLHVCSVFLQNSLRPGLRMLLQRAKGLGLTISLDTNWAPRGEWEEVNRWLSYADVFLPNEQEALAISGKKDVREALKALSKISKVVAIKLGAEGAIAQAGGEVVTAKALEVPLVDTVGAGDSFNAGFLFGFLNGWDLERCLRLGVVCGSLSTRSAGGTNAQPTLEEAQQYL
ncbi:MAG: carbohydrate kinase family protein [Chloroflexota bacterium]